MEAGLKSKNLACSDISFWEIAMLIRGGRLRSDVDAGQYTNDQSPTLSLTFLPISSQIAAQSQADFPHHKDPADRLIAATAICHNAPLISSDGKLPNIKRLNVIW